MANNRFSKQAFKPTTKKTITANLIKKAQENQHIIPVATDEIVQYRANDGTRPFYKVLEVRMDFNCMYEIQIQKIGADGMLMTQKFNTTMDKLERFWLQLHDRVKYSRKLNSGKMHEFIGAITSIYHDRENELTVELLRENKQSEILNEKDLQYLDLIE